MRRGAAVGGQQMSWSIADYLGGLEQRVAPLGVAPDNSAVVTIPEHPGGTDIVRSDTLQAAVDGAFARPTGRSRRDEAGAHASRGRCGDQCVFRRCASLVYPGWASRK